MPPKPQTDLSWEDATIAVLKDSGTAMHYKDIADQIIEKLLRRKFGATPATSVNVAISNSMKSSPKETPFLRVDTGRYILRDAVHTDDSSPVTTPHDTPSGEDGSSNPSGIVEALGMYWRRDRVLWQKEPSLWGEAQAGATKVNFCTQRGVYLLHDGREVIYVGRASDQHLGVRLNQHTTDRLGTRWDRFSWFGLLRVTPEAILAPPVSIALRPDVIIATLEAVLIEGLEPRQNRKRGDDFRAVEYLQIEDPEIQRSKKRTLLDELKRNL